MPWSWPVEVNFHEAEAYRAWRERRDGHRYRLLSEARHHRLRALPANSPNVGLRCGSPRPVNEGAPPAGPSDVFGNVWQWCEDHFHPLPGFRVHRLYDDFSTPDIDPAKWAGGEFGGVGREAVRLSSNGQLHLTYRSYGLTNSDTGASAGFLTLNFINPAAVTTIQATVRVDRIQSTGCTTPNSATTTARARPSSPRVFSMKSLKVTPARSTCS